MTFGTLALVVAVGLLGPMLALLPSRAAPPIVIGEILAGVVIGTTGFRRIDVNQPTLAFLADIGFALLMFIVGTRVPIRDRRLWSSARRGIVAAAIMTALSIAVAPLLARATDLHRPAIIAVLVAASSAAVVLSITETVGSPDAGLLVTMAWVTVADIVTIVAVPFVLATGTVAEAALGATLVVVCAAAVGVAARLFADIEPVEELRQASHKRGWALDLRVSLLVLFTLAALAEHYNTSILIAGFAAGVMTATLGPPSRVADQLIGLGEGFFVPLFFVVLGARLDLRTLVRSADDLRLFALLTLAIGVVPLLTALIMRLRPAHGFLVAAKLGVPAAIAQIGLTTGVLRAGQGAAIVSAAAVSLAVATVGAEMIGASSAVSPSND